VPELFALIYADGEENLAVTGGGALDGQADCEHWWPWKARENCGWRPGVPRQDDARNALFEMGATDVPIGRRVFGEGHYLRPNLFGPLPLEEHPAGRRHGRGLADVRGQSSVVQAT